MLICKHPRVKTICFLRKDLGSNFGRKSPVPHANKGICQWLHLFSNRRFHVKIFGNGSCKCLTWRRIIYSTPIITTQEKNKVTQHILLATARPLVKHHMIHVKCLLTYHGLSSVKQRPRTKPTIRKQYSNMKKCFCKVTMNSVGHLNLEGKINLGYSN